jgi:hypothetical protein
MIFVVTCGKGYFKPCLRSSFARCFLEMACKFGNELTEPPHPVPSGWAALMELYELR